MRGASTLASAAFRRTGIPACAVRHALRADRAAMSEAVIIELLDVLGRPCPVRSLEPSLCVELLGQFDVPGLFFVLVEVVTDCRDWKDSKYLELAFAAGCKATNTWPATSRQPSAAPRRR